MRSVGQLGKSDRRRNQPFCAPGVRVEPVLVVGVTAPIRPTACRHAKAGPDRANYKRGVTLCCDAGGFAGNGNTERNYAALVVPVRAGADGGRAWLQGKPRA